MPSTTSADEGGTGASSEAPVRGSSYPLTIPMLPGGGGSSGQTCRNGHLYTTETLYIRPSGFRDCRICKLATWARDRARRRALKTSRPKRSALDRFWSKVNRNGPIPEHAPDLGPCWIWLAGRHRNGYGFFFLDDRNVGAHVAAYRLLVGKIPEGLQLDHLCWNPQCVNPGHLEPVTGRINIWRYWGTVRPFCPAGHRYTLDNLVAERPGRTCKTCEETIKLERPSRELRTHCRLGHPYSLRPDGTRVCRPCARARRDRWETRRRATKTSA